MSENILRLGGGHFKRFVCRFTEGLNKPAVKFIMELLCGLLFTPDLILTHVASHVPQRARLSAVAKRLRRQLGNRRWSSRELWFNYLRWLKTRLQIDNLFILDLTDLAKPYARKMEHLAWVRDGDKERLVPGYWCVELYVLDKHGYIWPVILWPYSVEAEGQLSQNDQILKLLSAVDGRFGEGFGIYVCDCGFDGLSFIEPFLASKRHFIIRQRGDRTVVLNNGVHMIMADMVEHLFAQSRDWLVYRKVHLPSVSKALYVVAYHEKGYSRPMILLTDMVVENTELALQIRNRYVCRWDCESTIEFLKSQMGLERFAVRRYRHIQRLVFLAGLAMGFLSYLLAYGRAMRQRVDDKLRYSRRPKRLWFYRVTIALRDALAKHATQALLCWHCHPP